MFNPSYQPGNDFFPGTRLHWQPIVDLETGRTVGAEALLRPSAGTPTEMLDWIDRMDQWEEFTRWEMEQVLSDLSLLPPLEDKFFAFFNLSPRQCVSSFLFPWLSCFPSRVVPVIEVLEEFLKPEQESVLVEAKRRGFRLAVDDFGTGHSNISRLLDLSVDFVKIDRKLVQATGKNDRNLVDGIVRAIGRGRTEIRVLGEGIETESHARFAGKIGCASGQGWFFGKPMPIGELSRGLMSIP
jgi:EAL domain-containing protein (putative c-di-GMP-specific phosphodiesterase class I)